MAQAVKCLCLSYTLIIESHRKLFTPRLESLKSDLRKVETDYKIVKETFEEEVTGNMEAKH